MIVSVLDNLGRHEQVRGTSIAMTNESSGVGKYREMAIGVVYAVED